MEVKTKARKWGSSLAVILPRPVVEAKRIRENDDLIVEVKKRTLAGELFGKFPNWKRRRTAQALKEEMRREWGRG